ncbi:Transposase IS200 like protein [Stieleria maiorica]|uniref:Transposase IS200 like protein n=1 Tax=Stieleria maiorica TaxID=2795974 RepID=A0A5B9M9X6_9BACT|nr:transposase [Stieleria maiorica]QEF97026.1 Transposase IS200 like protein [Stieleria maiorica]
MPQDPESMYRWRRWTPQQRQKILDERRQRNHPPHSPAHIQSDRTSLYMITAACFEHVPVIGITDRRIEAFSNSLSELLEEFCQTLFAWVVLPNHYHALVDAPDLTHVLKQIGTLHGRSSFDWNGEESQRGRKVWCNAAETAMKSEGHYYATWNYILHNPVHHGYCRKWTEWPYSSANEYVEHVGREHALRIWRAYPIYDYGQDWDPPEL